MGLIVGSFVHNIRPQQLSLHKEQVRSDYCPTGPAVIKLFSCSTQLSTKFQLLMKIKLPTNKEVSFFKSLRSCIYHAYKC